MNAGKPSPVREVYVPASAGKRISWQGPEIISGQNFYLFQVKIQDTAGGLSSEYYYAAAAACGGHGYVECKWKSQ